MMYSRSQGRVSKESNSLWWTKLLPAVLFLLVAAACYFRLTLYGDLRLSIANNDTDSYISSSEARLPSWEMLTGRRLLTTNLIYAAFRPEGGYEILVNGSPATTRREVQPTFAQLVVFQNLLSAIGWAILALVLASRFREALLQIAVVLVVLLFAFTPQLADWDSLLASESLTFSLFALQLSLWILVIFRLFTSSVMDRGTVLLIVGWLLVTAVWTFLKDAHLYSLLTDAAALAGLLLFRSITNQRKIILLLAVVGILAGLFLTGWLTARASSRSAIQFQNLYRSNILSSPARVDFMRAHGMPDPASPDFNIWFSRHAQSSYFQFLAAHPGYVLTSYVRDGLAAFSSVLQPYFTSPESLARAALIPYGDIFHPTGPVPLLLDTILLIGVWMIVLRRQPEGGLPWAWLATWWLLSAHVNLFINIFGDAYALTRHSLFATTLFRLFFWVFSLVLIDLSLRPGTPPAGNADVNPIHS